MRCGGKPQRPVSQPTGSLMAFCSAAMPPVWICSNMGFSSGSSCAPRASDGFKASCRTRKGASSSLG